MWMILSFIIGALAVLFAVENNAPAKVTFLSWEFQQSLGVVLLIGFLAGFVAALIFYLPTYLRHRWRIRRHEKRIAEVEADLAAERGKRAQLEIERAESARAQAGHVSTEH
ncbi:MULTISPECIES: LapA family protein [Acidithiobacillus]|jgi:putative membrane protein|uniref:Lipopolysaccharide assembly protein A domain-containing protein n=4 Tax=Acidithiobacillus caldus TaxID=33059 RepID=F9ZMC3_ACICS|nr:MULTISPECIES: LapA family protein [Acidithiobacillus]AIA54481.1 hypothetical protein Acaty_c0597 [Acidithiobacillus caldus ATCC 51756]AEK57237.1 conserved hypothetical protein [Acidithiobacillus caldus SM-1]AUW31991.1 LapA family protein [Acidithiobacillus caldus]MBU2728404.1 LapA family protein [Acidithiobacillus caldus]MBU2734842.1 LapA family protein [Acidithiobacillus caldus ATCC 51756]